jgi:hypothetical protein
MKKIILLLAFVSILSSCSNGGNASSSNTPTTNIPIGTTVKLEASISSGSTIPLVSYRDSQSNIINLNDVTNNWTVTFQTTTINQYISLGAIGDLLNLLRVKFILMVC